MGAHAVTVTVRRQFEPAQHAGGGAQHKQDKQGIGVVEAEHERRDGRGDKHDAGHDAGGVTPHAAHGGIQQVGACDAHERLWQQNRKRAQAE